MITPVDCGKLCIYNGIPGATNTKAILRHILKKKTTIHKSKWNLKNAEKRKSQDKEKWGIENKQKTKNKMADLSPNMSIMTLNVNGITTPINSTVYWKKDLAICFL